MVPVADRDGLLRGALRGRVVCRDGRLAPGVACGGGSAGVRAVRAGGRTLAVGEEEVRRLCAPAAVGDVCGGDVGGLGVRECFWEEVGALALHSGG